METPHSTRVCYLGGTSFETCMLEELLPGTMFHFLDQEEFLWMGLGLSSTDEYDAVSITSAFVDSFHPKTYIVPCKVTLEVTPRMTR